MLGIDYIVASLPALDFNGPAPMTMAAFDGRVGGFKPSAAWVNLETQLRNAMATARHGARYCRPAKGCALYWRKRVADCFNETDVLKRDEALDRVWWDAAGEMTPPAAPLGKGAIETYGIRLGIVLKRNGISRDRGNGAFDRLTSETKI